MNNNKLFILLGIIMLFGISVVSAASNVPILQIPYCYNVSIHYRFTGQNFSGLSFPGCSMIDGNDWFCDCHNVVGIFNLTVNTPDVIQASSGGDLYQLQINYFTYSLESFSTTQSLFNYGSTGQSFGDVSDNGPITSCIPITHTVFVNVSVPKIVYMNTSCSPVIVNNTVFVDRNISVNATSIPIADQSDSINILMVAIFCIIIFYMFAHYEWRWF